MLIPIAGTIVAIGASGVCWRGVTVHRGSGPAGEWRIRWACWRWIVERKLHGAAWTRQAVYPMGQRALAIGAGQASVAMALGASSAPPPMVTIKARRWGY